MSNVGVTSRSDFLLRIVASGNAGRVGEEIAVAGGTATIGRDDGCTVVLAEQSVSRRHAQIEWLPEGFRVTDLESGNGVWVGEKRVKEEWLQPGDRFRVGSSVFECLPPRVTRDGAPQKLDATLPLKDEADEAVPPATGDAVGFRLHVRSAFNDGREEEEVTATGGSAVIGRDRGCAVVLDARDISRRHARVERHGDGFRVFDLESGNGVWVDGRRVQDAAILKPGQSFRLGERTIIHCYPLPDEASVAPAPVEEVAAEPRREPAAPPLESAASASPEVEVVQKAVEPAPERSVIMPVSPELLAETKRVEDEGEAVEVGASQPFLIDDARSVWYVVSGAIDIFTVAVKDGRPVGTRSHFLGILPGQCFFGLDLRRYAAGSSMLAVGKQGTRLRKIPLTRIKELAASPQNGRAMAALVDTWVQGLAKSLVRDVAARAEGAVILKAAEKKALSRNQRASVAEGVLWVDIWSSSIIFNDMATPVFTDKRVLFPLTPDSWAQPMSDEYGELAVSPVATTEAIGKYALWQGLDVFHQVLCECEFINKKLAAVDEFVRLEHKARHLEAAREAAYDAIGSVLRADSATPQEFLETGGSAGVVLRACELVGAAMGIPVKRQLEGIDRLTYEEKVAVIANASGFRTRVVALRGEWWKEDHGPLLGLIEKTKSPVALLPSGPRSFHCIEPKTGQRQKVKEDIAASLSGFAYSFYRPFPDGSLGVREVVRFGARGLAGDMRLLILMGVVIGLLGSLTPYATGRIFDAAIPQADRGMLWGFGLALLMSALATALFKLVQGVATLRVQGKMEYSIQAALWDRLLNLPANFFRKYPAGDLAERAAGVDAIQNLVAGAGIGAILGSFSGLFYVVLMFFYNVHLALLAIGLTLAFVGVTTLANYLQLRYQRSEIKLRGRISGLVLNLITGVSKLRIAGAEHHAFRVWAEQFSEQRKVSFAIGRVQNVVAVVSVVFPVLSSIAIFLMVLYAQKEAAEAGTPPPTTGEFIAFNSAYGLFLASMQALSDASLNLLRVVPIYERLRPIVTTPAEVDNTKSFPGKLKGDIELSHVHFRYHEDGPWVIKDLSLKIKPGEFVAFVGGSGCGKSTLMRLMLGFEQPMMGSIYYDGQDLSALDVRMLRQQMGVVLQVSRVMPTEIYRNITGISSRTIDEAWQAAEMAGLADDIRQMPMGMHTYVSEGGGTLSGGQRQRLLIARAVVNKPRIIFLDEATSALDNRTQATVTESMDRLDATRIVIAHRLSTVIHAHKICYLEAGQIAEMGTYQELMEKDGLFAQLAKRQMA